MKWNVFSMNEWNQKSCARWMEKEKEKDIEWKADNFLCISIRPQIDSAFNFISQSLWLLPFSIEMYSVPFRRQRVDFAQSCSRISSFSFVSCWFLRFVSLCFDSSVHASFHSQRPAAFDIYHKCWQAGWTFYYAHTYTYAYAYTLTMYDVIVRINAIQDSGLEPHKMSAGSDFNDQCRFFDLIDCIIMLRTSHKIKYIFDIIHTHMHTNTKNKSMCWWKDKQQSFEFSSVGFFFRLLYLMWCLCMTTWEAKKDIILWLFFFLQIEQMYSMGKFFLL